MVTDQRAGDAWRAVLGKLQLQVTRPSYDTWLKGTVGLSYDGNVFVVGAPNAFVAEMLDHRLHSLISMAVEEVVEATTHVSFQVWNAGSSDTPSNNGSRVREEGAPEGAIPQKEPSATSRPMTVRRSRMNPRYTFEAFIVGKSNELAHAAALAVSENPGTTYNPLFLYSGVGLGKTHLLHATGHVVAAKGLSLAYATTEEFTNEYIRAIREGKTEEFRNRYRSADILLLDDIQFIIGKEQTQEGFFHTFNALHMASRQIIVTSDRPPTSLSLLDDRIRSRLSGGLTVDIQPPDLETRLAILRDKAEGMGQSFPENVLEFLAERVHSNVRDLEGCLNRISAYSQLTASELNLDLVKRSVADVLHPAGSQRVAESAVLETVCGYFSIDPASIKGKRRDKQTALARQIAMYLLREEAGLPLSAIGRFMGGKNHTTVLHAHQRISSQITVDPHIRRDVFNLREALTNA